MVRRFGGDTVRMAYQVNGNLFLTSFVQTVKIIASLELVLGKVNILNYRLTYN